MAKRVSTKHDALCHLEKRTRTRIPFSKNTLKRYSLKTKYRDGDEKNRISD